MEATLLGSLWLVPLLLVLCISSQVQARLEDVRSKFLYRDNPAAAELVFDYQHHMHAPTHHYDALSSSSNNRSLAHQEAAEVLWRENERDGSNASAFVPTDPRPFFLRPEYPVARVVEFYSPWCGHCQSFAPRYVQTARELLERLPSSTIVEFFAVSCSEHHLLCQQQNVSGYPAIRAYDAKSTASQYSVLQPFTLDTINQALQLNMNTTASPITARQQHQQQQHVSDTAVGMASSLSRFGGDDGDVPRAPPSKLDILGATLDGYRRTRTDVFRDAALSFTYSLEHHFYATNITALDPEAIPTPMSEDRAEALSEWLDLLYWTLPPTWMLHALIHELRQNLAEVVKSKAALVTILEKHYEVVHEASSTDQVRWSAACQKHDRDGDGFGCGLWALWHIVSMGVVERHSAVLGARDRISTKHAGETLYHYVQHVAAWCDECRDVFIQEYENCAYKRCKRLRLPLNINMPVAAESWREFPMWLWQAHNGINEEMLRAKMRQMDKRKPTKNELATVRWPSQTACPSCYRPNGRWNEERVFSYLKKEYWPGGIQNFRYVVLDTKDRSKDKQETTVADEGTVVFLRLAAGLLVVAVLLVCDVANRSSRRIKMKTTGHHKKFDGPPNRRRLPH